MKPNRSLVVSFIAGSLLTLAVSILIRAAGQDAGESLLAEVAGEKLTPEKLRKEVTESLAPIENDEYRVLKRGAEEWVNERVVEVEAKNRGISPEELYQKEVWNRVEVSSGEARDHYGKVRELYDKPFETVSDEIFRELRRSKYAAAKEEFLAELRKKHNAKVLLKKPASYIEDFPEAARPTAPVEGSAGVKPAGTLPGAAAVSRPGEPPSLGPQNAPITITEFADFHCGFCKRADPTVKKLVESYPEKVRLVFRHYPLSTTPGAGSFFTHEAAACAQEQGKFWPYHDGIFAIQGAPGESDYYAIAERVGANRKAFEACLKEGRYRDFLLKERSEGSGRGVEGTPTFYVNDVEVAGAYPYEHFVQIIEGILDPSKAVPAAPAAPPAPPTNVQFDDLDGRPGLGPKNAPVTLVEFSDFHCPFCSRVGPAIEQLMETYQGKIRRIFRHYPLSFHAGADRAAEASECAHEQGKFWEYKKKLFENQGKTKDDASLIELAKGTGVNQKKFEACLQGGKYKALVQKEIQAGEAAGVRGTPAFFVNGKLVSGAKPYEEFDRIVKSELAKR